MRLDIVLEFRDGKIAYMYFTGFKGCITAERYHFANLPDCFTRFLFFLSPLKVHAETRIRSDGAHEAVDAARITRLSRLKGAA